MPIYYHIFPFEKVRKGAEIVLYGAGEVGQWYLAQLQQTGYAKVLAIADRDWDKYPRLAVPLIAPSELADIDFESLVISIEDRSIAKSVASSLEQNIGIDKDKIVLGSDSLAEHPSFVKPDALPTLAYQPRHVPAAVLLGGGLGDVIIYKRKIEELLAWDERLVLDVYMGKGMDEAVQSIFADEFAGRINAYISDGDQKFKEHKDKYAFAIVMSTDMNMDCFDEKKMSRVPQLLRRCRIVKKQSDEYGDMSQLNRARHYARCKKDHLNCYTSYNRYDGFDIQDWHTHIPIKDSYEKQFAALNLPARYVTINCGFDARLSQTMAKAWPVERFESLIRLFRQSFPDIGIIQTSGANFPVLLGCDRCFMGENLDLVKCVLRESLLHIDIEGGLVHLASQLGTRCAVLFGPTPLHYYGYKENINIQAGSCEDCCWYVADYWSCYRKMPEPECMYAITPELVLAEIDKCMGAELRS